MIDLLICAFIYAQPATNLQIIEDETKVIFDSIALKLPVNPDVITYHSNSNDAEIQSYLLNQLVQYFADRETVINLDSARYKVVFEDFDIKTEYRENEKGMLGISRVLIRNIDIRTSGYLVDQNLMDVFDRFRYNISHTDTLNSDKRDYVEDCSYSFCRGRTTSPVTWTKYIEPAVVITSVAGIIFLFFTMRF